MWEGRFIGDHSRCWVNRGCDGGDYVDHAARTRRNGVYIAFIVFIICRWNSWLCELRFHLYPLFQNVFLNRKCALIFFLCIWEQHKGVHVLMRELMRYNHILKFRRDFTVPVETIRVIIVLHRRHVSWYDHSLSMSSRVRKHLRVPVKHAIRSAARDVAVLWKWIGGEQ